MNQARVLRLPAQPPVDRGELLTADEVAARYLRGTKPAKWVRQHVRPCVRLGHRTVLFYVADVEAWLERQRSGGTG